MAASAGERRIAAGIALVGFCITAILALRAFWLSSHGTAQRVHDARWFVQLGAYRERQHALEAQRLFAAKGLRVHSMPKDGLIVLVLGPFADRSEAQKALRSARRIEPEAFLWQESSLD